MQYKLGRDLLGNLFGNIIGTHNNIRIMRVEFLNIEASPIKVQS